MRPGVEDRRWVFTKHEDGERWRETGKLRRITVRAKIMSQGKSCGSEKVSDGRLCATEKAFDSCPCVLAREVLET
eukprot:2515172-Pleurochrysis_carterae.AAC.1